uniref:Secreted protein n=1 Tax=Achlya hypogyna TaxID=1202772 RepID=A0A0A7CNF9_ACHHY|nr:secreted protein [Achlya hypogyna]
MAKWALIAAFLIIAMAEKPCEDRDPFEVYEQSPCDLSPVSSTPNPTQPSTAPLPTSISPIPSSLVPTGSTPTPTGSTLNPTTTLGPTPTPSAKVSFCDYKRQVLSEYYSAIYTDVGRDSINEQFVYDASTQTLVAQSNGECLDGYLGENNAFQVHTYPCDASNGNQKWNFNIATNRIEHVTHKDLCMVSGPAGSKARVEPCSDSLEQFFTECDEPATVDLTFQTCYTNSWLSEYYTGLYADQRRGSVNENWAYDPQAQTLQVGSNGQCLDAFPVDNGKYGLHTYACDNTNNNQKWIIQGKLVKHAVWDCTPYNKNQCWNIRRQ